MRIKIIIFFCRCWTAGWGVSSFNNGQYQNPLRHVEVPIVSQAACETSLRNTRLGYYYNLDRTSFMCAGGESGRDSCTVRQFQKNICNNFYSHLCDLYIGISCTVKPSLLTIL